MFYKKGVFTNFVKFAGKYLCQSLFNKVACSGFIKKKTPTQMFSCEVYEIFKNTFFTEHNWATASGQPQVIPRNLNLLHVLYPTGGNSYFIIIRHLARLLSYCIFFSIFTNPANIFFTEIVFKLYTYLLFICYNVISPKNNYFEMNLFSAYFWICFRILTSAIVRQGKLKKGMYLLAGNAFAKVIQRSKGQCRSGNAWIALFSA